MTTFSFDPNALMQERLRLGKVEAARRQLDTCIEMFFENRDVVSQHTLCMAAHSVLFNLCTAQGITGSLANPQVGTESERLYAVKAFKVPQNFFKHADRDPDGSVLFFPSVTQFMMMDGARLYVLLTDDVTRAMKVFFMWFQLRYPDLFCFEPAEEELRVIRQSVRRADEFKTIGLNLLRSV